LEVDRVRRDVGNADAVSAGLIVLGLRANRIEECQNAREGREREEQAQTHAAH